MTGVYKCKICALQYPRTVEYWPRGKATDGMSATCLNCAVKQCTGCGKMKTLIEYHADIRREDGRNRRCRKCINSDRRRQKGQIQQYGERTRKVQIIAERRRLQTAEERDKAFLDEAYEILKRQTDEVRPYGGAE